MRDRPDQHIEVQGTVDLGDSAVATAQASGTGVVEGQHQRQRLEWLTHYPVLDRRITEINVLAVMSVAPE